jgi:prepilin-type processing-associated H-X9-DG protein
VSYELRSLVASFGKLMLTVLKSSAQQQLVFRASTQRYIDDVMHANVTGTASYCDGHVTAYQVCKSSCWRV